MREMKHSRSRSVIFAESVEWEDVLAIVNSQNIAPDCNFALEPLDLTLAVILTTGR